ncbi:MAG: hypothetical protein ACRCSV_03055 [Chlamydiales bacterium]
MKNLLDELILHQKARLFALAREIVPYITTDDLLQPCDFPELENHAYFRYEEGLLAGLLTVQSAFLSRNRQDDFSNQIS